MRRFLAHFKLYMLRGFWAVIPLALSLFALRLLYVSIDQRVLNFIDDFTGFRLPGLGIVLSVLFLYLLGLAASNVVGKQFLGLIERISDRLPVVKTTYRVGRQLASTFTLPERQVFRRVVLVEYLTPGMWTVGFVTGYVTDPESREERLLKVYIPTPPNPTSGTMVIVRQGQTRDPGWSVEEAMKSVISAGIIGPSEIRSRPGG